MHREPVLRELGLQALQLLLEFENLALSLGTGGGLLALILIYIVQTVQNSVILQNRLQVDVVGKLCLGGNIGGLVSCLHLGSHIIDQLNSIQKIQICGRKSLSAVGFYFGISK